MASSTHSPTSHLLRLPTEILFAINRHLPNRDIKSLRLSCSLLKSVAPLRLDRVFLSANPRNVEVFNAIAAHDLRHQVVEIVWDDALLVEDDSLDDDSWLGYSDEEFYEGPDGDDAAAENFPRWFGRACKENVRVLNAAYHLVPATPHWTTRQMLPILQCWAYYKKLLQQQRDVLQTGAHIRALEEAWSLQRFPALRTITITPASHGRLFCPLFETPMIRAFPPGFNYRIPRGWPTDDGDDTPEAEEWDDDNTSDWPGFRIVTSIVARYPHDLAELRVDAFQLPTGLNVRVFEEPCRALADFTTLLARPSFQHLHLDLLVGAQESYGWPAFTRGHLARALSAASLQSLSIRTNVYLDICPDEEPEYHVSLRTIFSTASLACVRHFRLAGFYVREDEVMQILADLPPALLQTVELSYLKFGNDGDEGQDGSFRRLLMRIRDELQWRNVRLTIGGPLVIPVEGQAVWVNVDEFLYRGGENPFSSNNPSRIQYGFGTAKDVFDTTYEHPNIKPQEKIAMGYTSCDDWGKKVCRR